jgi:raffinose/stachyose/melibiose transport system substrate-binding protein
MKKILSVFMVIASILFAFALTSCDEEEVGKVYYLNFKPEQDGDWQKLAKKYTELNGVEVKVVTAAAGTYESTLTAELDKDSAPTLFQINGAVGYNSWKNYCLDLTNTDLHKELTSNDFAVMSNGKVYGIAYVYEGFGIIVNKKLLKDAGYEVSDINNFAKLQSVAKDITARKDALGFSAFTSAGLDSSSAWRFSGHLANMPLYYEFAEDKITSQPAKIKGTYLDAFRNLWDLYINNSTVSASVLPSKTGVDTLAEFTTGKAVFYQNGTWEYSNVIKDSVVKPEDLGYLPIYTGIKDENQGLCCGTENYWAVNSQASKADQEATLKFLHWVVTSEEGTTALAKNMGFVSPFKKAKPVDNVLCNIMNEYVAKGCYNVSWAFNYTPNVDAWRAGVVDALAAYSADQTTANWEKVQTAFVKGWEDEYAKQNQ